MKFEIWVYPRAQAGDWAWEIRSLGEDHQPPGTVFRNWRQEGRGRSRELAQETAEKCAKTLAQSVNYTFDTDPDREF